MIYGREVSQIAPLMHRRTGWAIVAIALLIAATVAVVIARPWLSPAATSAAGSEVIAAADLTPLTLPDDPTVLIFGDSWTYGSAATDPTLGYAYVVAQDAGWTTIVNGVRGSGYLKPGIDGPAFGERIAALDPSLDPDLIIVQGSINDRRMGAAGYRDAVRAAWDQLTAIYPDARIVVLGPAPQVLPVEPATARIDQDLSALSAERGWWYISPIAENWITDANYLSVIDTSEIGRDHPTTAGHAYLAERLAAAMEAISAPKITAAGPGDSDLPQR